MSDKDKHEQMALQAFFSRLGFDYSKEKEWKDSNEWKEFRRLIRRSIRKLKEIEELERKLIESRKLIIEEAKKRKWDIPKIVHYYFKHPEELINLLGEKLPDQRIFKNPKEFSELTLSLFSNIGFSYRDYEGQTDERGIIEYVYANKKGQMALLPQSKISSLIKKQKEGQGLLFPPPPDAAVSQLKNLHTLVVLLERQNKERVYGGEDKTNVIEFYLKEYEEVRGKTEEELARGGKFRDLFKYTLVSGGITTFVSEDERYYKIRHHHFYDIDIPKNPKEKWKVYINNPYAEALLNFKQYIPIFLKAIKDKQTDHNKGYLYFFLMTVLHYSNNLYIDSKGQRKVFTAQMKVSTLLEKIKIGERVENRPSEAFRVLAECISYVADNYKDVLSEIRLLNSKYEPKIIRDLSIFKNIDYEQFKASYLNDLGIKDIREALISFNAIAPKEESGQEPKDYNEGFYLPV